MALSRTVVDHAAIIVVLEVWEAGVSEVLLEIPDELQVAVVSCVVGY